MYISFKVLNHSFCNLLGSQLICVLNLEVLSTLWTIPFLGKTFWNNCPNVSTSLTERKVKGEDFLKIGIFSSSFRIRLYF